MHWQYSPYAPILVLLIILSLVQAMLAWRRRPARAALLIVVLMLAAGEFSLAYLILLLSPDLSNLIFWAKLQYVGYLALLMIWLVFVLEYTDSAELLTRRNIVLALIVPVSTLLVLGTNDYHHWFYRTASLDIDGTSSVLTFTYGPFFWVQGAYTYLLVLLGGILLIQKFQRNHRLYPMQLIALLVGAMIPWIADALYFAGPDRVPHRQLAFYTFILSATAIVWGLLRYRLMDIKRVARAAVIDGMIDGVIVLDLDDRVVDLNAAAQKIIGEPGSVLRHPASRVLHGWSDLAISRRGSVEARAELQLPCDGNERSYDLRVSSLRNPEGDPAGRLLVLRDITDRVAAERAEREQRDVAEALRDAAATLASTLDSDVILDRILLAASRVVPSDCTILLSIEGDIARVVRVNDYRGDGLAATMLGLTLPINETTYLRDMLATGRSLAIPDTRTFGSQILPPGAESIRSFLSIPICIKDKIVGFLSLGSLSAGFYTAVHVEHLQVFADDVAIALQNAQMYSSLERAYAELTAALKAKDEMVRNVSHELRSPLATGLAYLELLNAGHMGPLKAAQQQAVNVLSKETRRLHFMVERLLTLQSFRPEILRREPLELAHWIRERAELWCMQVARDELQLRVEVPARLPLVSIDAQFFAQVLDNLLDNACKFSPSGGEILVTAWARETEVVMAVRDHGIGIPPEKQTAIFDRFYQVDGGITRSHGGMGIGLALVRMIVEAHGGRVWVESPGEGLGSSFLVELDAETY